MAEHRMPAAATEPGLRWQAAVTAFLTVANLGWEAPFAQLAAAYAELLLAAVDVRDAIVAEKWRLDVDDLVPSDPEWRDLFREALDVRRDDQQAALQFVIGLPMRRLYTLVEYEPDAEVSRGE